MLKARLNLESLDGRFVPDATQPLTTDPTQPVVVEVAPPSDPTPPVTDPRTDSPVPPTDGPQVGDLPK